LMFLLTLNCIKLIEITYKEYVHDLKYAENMSILNGESTK
jgi:hypothetical protein